MEQLAQAHTARKRRSHCRRADVWSLPAPAALGTLIPSRWTLPWPKPASYMYSATPSGLLTQPSLSLDIFLQSLILKGTPFLKYLYLNISPDRKKEKTFLNATPAKPLAPLLPFSASALLPVPLRQSPRTTKGSSYLLLLQPRRRWRAPWWKAGVWDQM